MGDFGGTVKHTSLYNSGEEFRGKTMVMVASRYWRIWRGFETNCIYKRLLIMFETLL